MCFYYGFIVFKSKKSKTKGLSTVYFSLGRKQALEFLRKSGTADPEAIKRLESGCKVVWTEDDPTIPPGKYYTSELNSMLTRLKCRTIIIPNRTRIQENSTIIFFKICF